MNYQSLSNWRHLIEIKKEVFSKMLQAFMQRLHNARFVKPTISALVLISQCLNDVERKNMDKAIRLKYEYYESKRHGSD